MPHSEPRTLQASAGAFSLRSPDAATLNRMSLTLKLLHLWGTPQAWTFEGDDEETLALILSDLDEFKADTKSKRAVLFVERQDRSSGAGRVTAFAGSRPPSSSRRHHLSGSKCDKCSKTPPPGPSCRTRQIRPRLQPPRCDPFIPRVLVRPRPGTCARVDDQEVGCRVRRASVPRVSVCFRQEIALLARIDTYGSSCQTHGSRLSLVRCCRVALERVSLVPSRHCYPQAARLHDAG